MSADDLMCEGIEYLTEGNYIEALNYFEKSLEIDQNLPECNYYKGLTNQLLSKLEISLESFDIELSLNANHINSLIAKGTSLCLLSRKEEGIKEYNKVLELEPNNIQALLNKSIALHDLNKTNEALDCINKLIEIDNNNYLPYLTKGNILAKNGQNVEAIENYKLSLEKNNISTQALYNMGICYLNMKDYQQANKCFDDALLINPNLLEIYIAKAKIFEEQKNYNNAIELYNEIIPKFPYDDNIFYKKGICLENMEEYQEALKNFEQGLDINKSNIDCLYHKGYCCDILNNKKQALKCYDDIIKSKEKNIDNKIKEDCLILKSKILIDDEKYDDALQGLNEALRLNPDNSYIYFYKGFINNKKGEHQEALNNYLKSIEINNKDKIIYYNLGLAYLEISDFEKSLNYLNKSYELDNTFYQALIKSGEVLLKSKEYDKSIEIFDKILNNEKEKNNELALLRKGDALFMKNSFKEALELYENVLKLNENNEEALIGAGICERKLFKLDEAINYYDRVLKINNNNENVLYNKAIALSLKGNNQDSNDLLTKAKSIKDSEDILYAFELNNLNDKNYSKVNEEFDNYIKENKQITNPGLYNIKAQSLLHEEKYDEALKYIEQALELNPNYTYAINTKANILDKTGKKDEALLLYQKAVEGEQDNIIFLLNYSLSLLENKNKEKSKEIFEKVKSLYYESQKNNFFSEDEKAFIEASIQKLEDKFKPIKS